MKSTSQPVSLRLDPALLKRVTAFARSRKIGLSTALRMIVSEHLDAAESAAEHDAALRWQEERAWSAQGRWERKESPELSLDDLKRAHADALRPARAR